MDNSKKSKSELLNQLKIDRSSAPEAAALTMKTTLMIAFASALFGASIVYFGVDFFANKSSIVSANKNQQDVKSSEPLNSSPVETSSQKIESESILNASGYITARRTATVSAEIMGLINAVNVEEGMTVMEGQILAQLDDTLAKVNVDLAAAQLASVKARYQSALALLDEARRQNKRVLNNDFSSEAEKSRALTDLATAIASLATVQADIKVAEFELQRQKERLADHVIRAPFDGVVTIKNAQPGEIVSPSSAGGGFTRTGICTIVDMDSLEIEVDVNESFIGRIYAAQKVEAQLDAYSDWTIPASVIAIIPTADRSKATVKVRIGIDVKDNKILPDMGVKVAFLK